MPPVYRLNSDFSNGLLKAAIFWAFYNESSDGTQETNDAYAPTTCFQTTGFDSEKVIRAVHNEEPTESPFCRSDRYLAIQTMLNGYLAQERTPYHNTEDAFSHMTTNFAGSFGNEDYKLWQSYDFCWPDNITYGNMLASPPLEQIEWMDRFLECVVKENRKSDSEFSENFIRLYEDLFIHDDTLLVPNDGVINQVLKDFYTYCDSQKATYDPLMCDPTSGAVGLMGVNVNGRSIITCVGSCDGSIPDPSQSQIQAAFNQHMNDIADYIPYYDSVVQPVLWVQHAYNEDLGTFRPRLYVWMSRSYQQTPAVSEYPESFFCTPR